MKKPSCADIKNFTLKELKKAMPQINEPAYRAEQIFFWLYQKAVSDFDQMRNLPQMLKEKLKKSYYITSPKLQAHLESRQGAEKFLFKLADGNFIETVLVSTGKRKTVCLSTQVGCKFGCSFCASGSRGFVRNLTCAEMLNQILFLPAPLEPKITNYVFMGMGEPLDNWENLSPALLLMNDPRALNIGARRITISTCGIIPGIDRLKKLGLQINLSISLHAPNNQLRNILLPINQRYPLKKLLEACADYIKTNGRIITLEYILIRDKNDSWQNADELAQIAARLKAKVNLIPCSRTANLDWQAPSRKARDLFIERLRKRRIKVTLRQSKGEDIQAACGQLAGRTKEGQDLTA